MSLAPLMRLHAAMAAPYALALLFAPTWLCGLLSPHPLGIAGVEVARLFGAATALVTCVAWIGAGLDDRRAQRRLAAALLLYMVLGTGISLAGQLGGAWGPLGWSNVAVYGVLALAYARRLRGR
ncbi:MAG: hypothetical protein KC420_21060 [Myxococcales bacterium]|nr:hypothetical protein [Myxococcales bacterium]MCB9700849.1 hypothetical protein [Myxococcales bacterium]